MDSQKIETLLERYWTCETSVEEERSLKEFFSGDDIPGHLLMYAPFFAWKNENASLRTSTDFAQNIKQRVQAPQHKQHKPVVRYFYPALKIAASVLIVVVVGLGIHTHNQNQKVLIEACTETYSDPEEALEGVYFAFDKIGNSLIKAQVALESTTDSMPAELDTKVPPVNE